MKSFQNGDVKILGIILHSIDNRKSVNIINQCKNIDIYEDIFSPSVYGEIFVYDSIDLLNDFPILGEERIEIQFSTNNEENKIYNLFVVEITEISPNDTEKGKTFTLRLVSEEHLINQTFKISKKYSDGCDNIVRDLFNQLQSPKSLFTEKSKGIEEILIPKMYIFQAVDFIRQRAVSLENISSSYLFFENSDGFHFKTIEKLFEDGSKRIGTKKFYFDQVTKEDTTTVQYRNILNMSRKPATNTVEKLNNSQNYAVRTFDILTGGTTFSTYINSNDQTKYKFFEETKPLNTSAFEKKYSKGFGQVYFVPKDSSKPDNFIEEKIIHQNAYMNRLMQNIITINVYGDSELKAGDVIECNLPAGGLVFTEKEKADRLINGNYLIKSLHHMIILGKQNRYYCAADIIKGNYLDDV